MLQSRWSAGATIVLALLFLLPASGASNPAPQVQTNRGPILIDGDSSFTAANGVIGGSGSWSNPYVIAGWNVSPATDTVWWGISVQHTRLPFVIRDVQVNSFAVGIALGDSFNGRIESASFAKTPDAIQLNSVSNVTLSRLAVSTFSPGVVRIWDAQQVSVVDSELSGGILVERSSGVDIVGNRADGIGATESSNVRINRNLPTANGLGIGTYRTTDVTISQNGALGSEIQRILIQNSTRTVVMDNFLSWKADQGVVPPGWYCSLCVIGSTDGIVSGNQMWGDGIYLGGSRPEHYFTNALEGNIVDGKPIRLFRDCLDLRLEGARYAQVLIVFCSRVVLEGMVFSGPRLPLQLAYASSVKVSNSTFESETGGIYVVHSKALDVIGNTFRTGFTSAWFENSEGIRFASNNATAGYSAAVRFIGTRSVRIESNHLTARVGSGVGLESATDVVIVSNTVDSQTPAVIIYSHNVSIYSNNFVRFDDLPIVRGSDRVAWDAGYPLGGNFWGGYSGGDACSGPTQEDCSSPDGFGDKAVSIDATNVDRYPLMSPWAPPGPRTSLPEQPTVVAMILVALGLISVPFVIVFILLRVLRGRPPKRAPLPDTDDVRKEAPNLILASRR